MPDLAERDISSFFGVMVERSLAQGMLLNEWAANIQQFYAEKSRVQLWHNGIHCRYLVEQTGSTHEGSFNSNWRQRHAQHGHCPA